MGNSFATAARTRGDAVAEVDGTVIIRAVTSIMGTVVGLTFLFGFGNVLTLALRLGVPVWVAPLVAPAVDLSILGLLLGTRYLVLAGAPSAVLQPARRLLIFASVVTLALNVAEPLTAGQFGKAVFDAVGPLLLIGWSEVGPGLLEALAVPTRRVDLTVERKEPLRGEPGDDEFEMFLDQARREDAAHRAAHQKPISSDNLRARIGVGSARARRLVKIIRDEFEKQQAGLT